MSTSSSGPSVCVVCLSPSNLRCSACSTTYYCTRQHQQQHWKIHKSTCNKQQTHVANTNTSDNTSPSHSASITAAFNTLVNHFNTMDVSGHFDHNTDDSYALASDAWMKHVPASSWYAWIVDVYRVRLDDDAMMNQVLRGLYDESATKWTIVQDFLYFCNLVVLEGIIPSDLLQQHTQSQSQSPSRPTPNSTATSSTSSTSSQSPSAQVRPTWNWADFLDTALTMLPFATTHRDAITKFGSLALGKNGITDMFRYVGNIAYGCSVEDNSDGDDQRQSLLGLIDKIFSFDAAGIFRGTYSRPPVVLQLFEQVGGILAWKNHLTKHLPMHPHRKQSQRRQ